MEQELISIIVTSVAAIVATRKMIVNVGRTKGNY